MIVTIVASLLVQSIAFIIYLLCIGAVVWLLCVKPYLMRYRVGKPRLCQPEPMELRGDGPVHWELLKGEDWEAVLPSSPWDNVPEVIALDCAVASTQPYHGSETLCQLIDRCNREEATNRSLNG